MLTSLTLFFNLKQWIPEIKLNNPKCKLILVATKSDLRDEESVLSRLRERGFSPITTKQGKILAKNIGATFIEVDKNITSAQFSQVLSKSSKKKKGGGCNLC